MYGLYVRRSLPEYFQCNQLIHQKIVAAAGNVTLSATYTGFTDRIRRVRYSANLDRKRDRWSEAMREHEMILDALRRRASDDLTNILFLHLRNKCKAVVEYRELEGERHKTLK
jgi:DNA-binding GntR family transcriptional regulator